MRIAPVIAAAGVLVALGSAAALGLPAGCSRAGVSVEREAGPPVDAALMAFLSEARALHHEANLREQGGDVAGAVDALERLVDASRPHPGRRVPEVDEVLADTYARLAELHLAQGKLDEALEAVHKGIEHAPSPTYFRGHLLEVEGLVEESRAEALADAGKPDAASQARERAIGLLEDVVEIQEAVIQRSLSAGDGGEP